MALSDFLVEKMQKRLGFTPTEDQDNLFDRLSSFVSQGEGGDILIINGYAGTGKTSAISAFVKTLDEFKIKFKLLAPTGRAAKVIAGYSGYPAYTIHKQIYRQKSMAEGFGHFTLDINKNSNTFFIVDEASLITVNNSSNAHFGSGDLLDDLITYARSNQNNKVIFLGDNAQLPPIGFDRSPALDPIFMSKYGDTEYIELKSVVRQDRLSGILHNATLVRYSIEDGDDQAFPNLKDGFDDIERISGGELVEMLNQAIERYGAEEVIVLCRSNKRANRYNSGIRSNIFFREEQLVKGDKLMVVKNCYQFLEEIEELDFIANGDVAELVKISGYEERYGLHFANAILSFRDYNNVEIRAKVILDTLESETPALTPEQQKMLFEGVYADYDNYKTKRKRLSAVREDLFFNALQIKYASAITGHKSQGGQWKCVFIDNAFWREEISTDEKKWLYTALTRAIERVYLVNFNKKFFEDHQ